jgi:hypothetical protein
MEASFVVKSGSFAMSVTTGRMDWNGFTLL